MLGGSVGGVLEVGYVTGLGVKNKCHQGSTNEDIGEVGEVNLVVWQFRSEWGLMVFSGLKRWL